MMLAPCMRNNSALLHVLLFGEGIMHFGGGFNLKIGRVFDRELTIRKEKRDVIQQEGLIVRRRARILSRA